MQQQPLIKTLSEAQLVPSFIQAVNDIQTYSKWIITQSLPDAQLNNTLQQMRTHAGAWYNSIYPQYLNMPADILTAATAVDNDLAVLQSLAQQEKSLPGSPTIQQQITQYAGSLVTTINGFLSQVKGLSSALTTFQQNVKGDAAIINATEPSINTSIQNSQQEFSAASGRLQSLENAACPNKADIESCGNTIILLKTQLQQDTLALQLFGEAAYLVNGAILGAHFLTGYWTGVCNDIQSCINGLKNISQSGSLAVLDLQTTQARWKTIQSKFTQITNQL